MKVKKVLVTGANKGIGFGIAKHLGLSGWQVIIGARDKERAEKAIRELQALDIEVSGWVNIELTDFTGIEKAVEELVVAGQQRRYSRRYERGQSSY